MRTKNDFENWYNTINPWGFDNSVNDKARQALLLEHIKYCKFNICLDIGCGEGVLTSIINKYVNHIDAFDISNIAIQRAKVNRSKDINFYQLDAREFAAQKYYDLIICS